MAVRMATTIQTNIYRGDRQSGPRPLGRLVDFVSKPSFGIHGVRCLPQNRLASGVLDFIFGSVVVAKIIREPVTLARLRR